LRPSERLGRGWGKTSTKTNEESKREVSIMKFNNQTRKYELEEGEANVSCPLCGQNIFNIPLEKFSLRTINSFILPILEVQGFTIYKGKKKRKLKNK